jgi:hypothetical protein
MATFATKWTDDASRLVRPHHELDILVERLQKLRTAIRPAHRHLTELNSNSQLGSAYLRRFMQQYRDCLKQLAAARRNALGLLGGIEGCAA